MYSSYEIRIAFQFESASALPTAHGNMAKNRYLCICSTFSFCTRAVFKHALVLNVVFSMPLCERTQTAAVLFRVREEAFCFAVCCSLLLLWKKTVFVPLSGLSLWDTGTAGAAFRAGDSNTVSACESCADAGFPAL